MEYGLNRFRVHIKPRHIAAAFVVAIIGLAMVLSNVFAERERLAVSDFSEGWMLKNGETVDVDDLDTGDYDGYIVMTKVLPNRLDYDDALCFISANTNFTVFVNGHLEYIYHQDPNLTGRGYGIAYHTVSLAPEYENGTVKIVMNAVFRDDHGGHIRMMSLEDSRSYCSRLIKGQLLSYNISVGIMIIGVMLLFLRLILTRRRDQPNIAALGLTAFIVGAWLANDTGMLRLTAEVVILGRIVDYVCMHVWLLPLSIFIFSLTRERNKLYLVLIHSLIAFDIVFFLIMRYAFGYDMYELTVLFIVYYVLVAVIMSVMLYRDHKYCQENGIDRDLSFFFYGLGILFFTMAIDIGVYMAGVRSVTGRGHLSRVGFCVFFMTMGIETLRAWIQERASLRRDTYTDPMTGVRNRRAFDEFEESHVYTYPYGYVMCDINGLKTVNDTLGHDEGDKLITDVAECLSEAFGHNRVFRLGGDEFAVYSFVSSEDEFNAQIDQARKLLEEKSRSASIGAVYVTDESIDRKQTRNRAEELMYEEKERYYQDNQDRRRRD